MIPHIEDVEDEKPGSRVSIFFISIFSFFIVFFWFVISFLVVLFIFINIFIVVNVKSSVSPMYPPIYLFIFPFRPSPPPPGNARTYTRSRSFRSDTSAVSPSPTPAVPWGRSCTSTPSQPPPTRRELESHAIVHCF